VIKSGGELVMPKEIEDFLSAQPGVSQAHVVGIPDDRWGEVCCAFVSAEAGAAIDPDLLIDACRANLARFKVPRRIFVLGPEAIPQTASGKVQKFKLIPMAQQLARDDSPTDITHLTTTQGDPS
jgi:fatty-acyl-CoA synthase